MGQEEPSFPEVAGLGGEELPLARPVAALLPGAAGGGGGRALTGALLWGASLAWRSLRCFPWFLDQFKCLKRM